MPSSTPHAPAVADTPTSVEVRVLLFSVLRERLGVSGMAVSLDAPATGGTLVDQLVEQNPALRDYRSILRLAVNERYVPFDTPLRDGDEVALITPVSGG